jgi:putative toxin-antitoxin system antitoxin component (TIGR02293 family)
MLTNNRSKFDGNKPEPSRDREVTDDVPLIGERPEIISLEGRYVMAKRREQLFHVETGRIARVARIVALAEHVLGNHEKALSWLQSKDDRFNGQTPLSMLRTESGGRLVETMLWQIDEGIYA